MGGIGSGGSRIGAGRKSKEAKARWLGGSADKRAPKDGKAPELAPIEPVDVPIDMSDAERRAWLQNAPYATAARTLTRGTAEAFRELCQAIVRERRLWARIDEDGFTYLKVSVDGAGVEHQEIKAHPLLAQHRGMLQRVEAGRLRFRLAPNGKALEQVAKPADPFDEFESKGTVQ